MHVAKINLNLQYSLAGVAHFCFNIEAAHTPLQRIVAEEVTVTPGIEKHHYCDANNGNRFIRFDAPSGLLNVNYQATVELQPQEAVEHLEEVSVSEVPDHILRYMMPSRYCESDVMSRSAQQIFGHIAPGYQRVKAVTEWVRDAVTYLPGSTTSTTTAQEVFVLRAGVCRDYAHLGITMCRALNIPARLVVGYVNFEEPPQDFHAIFEAWLGGRWVLFDPSGMAPVDRLVRIGTGRDAKDVAFATIFGPAMMTSKEVTVDESDSDTPIQAAAATPVPVQQPAPIPVQPPATTPATPPVTEPVTEATA
ncbi:MAG: transglutaminase family protein [Comamonadaceae bacterium]|nr:MAG: transglutaminase family protein [Comamonadaceae bacterium]